MVEIIWLEDRVVIERGITGHVAYFSDAPGRKYLGRSKPEALGRLIGGTRRDRPSCPSITSVGGWQEWAWPEPMTDAEYIAWKAQQSAILPAKRNGDPFPIRKVRDEIRARLGKK